MNNDMIEVKIITPDIRVSADVNTSFRCAKITLPALCGEMQVLRKHENMVVALSCGRVKLFDVVGTDQSIIIEMCCFGGIAKISNEGALCTLIVEDFNIISCIIREIWRILANVIDVYTNIKSSLIEGCHKYLYGQVIQV